MIMPFFLPIFTVLFVLIGCGEKITHEAIGSENSKELAIEEANSIGEAAEELPPVLEPVGPSLVVYPRGAGGGSGGSGSRSGSHEGCAQAEGNSCDTGEPAPFNEGRIVCENGQSICRPNVRELTYYLNIADFAASMIQIPTSNISGDSSTINSSYLAGRASIYNTQNIKSGTCSASFLNIQNADGIYTDISNYLSINNGLIVTWFTPTTLINLELDTIIHSMVTECIVLASTKVGFNPFYGETFNMVVSSDDEKIYFELTRIDD